MTTDPNERFRSWMHGNLERAVAELGVTVHGSLRWGWNMRSVSTAATDSTGSFWLRVGSERERDLPHPCWDGLPTANAVQGVPKPRVLRSIEWAETQRDPARRVRADLMTWLPGNPCAPSEPLRSDLDMSDTWWHSLRRALDALRATPSTRDVSSRWSVNSRILEDYGDQVARQMAPTRWETVHGDLHWNNLLGPRLGLLDWEMWGRGPVGTDAASLYCYSLLTPETARRVWAVFEDVLDSPAGRTALFRAAARLLRRAPRDYPDLAEPLQHLVRDAQATTVRGVV